MPSPSSSWRWWWHRHARVPITARVWPSRRHGGAVVVVAGVVVALSCQAQGAVTASRIVAVVVVVASSGCRQFEFHAGVAVVVVVVLGGLYSELVVWVTKAQWDEVRVSTSPRIGSYRFWTRCTAEHSAGTLFTFPGRLSIPTTLAQQFNN